MKTLTMLALAALTAAVTYTPAAARDIIPDTCTYTNPILHADYSDPDAIRVGGDYWMTASSFNHVPGLQILHSADLVHWKIVNAALPRMTPEEDFANPSHGNGVWAPSIRHHDGLYWIFWGDPDRGIYCITAEDPAGQWSTPHLVIEGRGMIDPCPLWDEDGRVWLVHGWAGSRAGFKSVLSIRELAPDCSGPVGEEILIFDGKHNGNPTVEGPKFYKRDGWYYILAPAGGVKEGWQLVLRSRSVTGPYEYRNVLAQGTTDIHGPHQGAWVEDTGGGHWFLHFEDRYAYGRVVHLQPMTWDDEGWCVMGTDPDSDGTGEPVISWQCPPVSASARQLEGPDALERSDSFTATELSPIWQWPANPGVGQYFLNPSEGSLRLICRPLPEGSRSLWDSPSLLLRKLIGPEDSFTARLSFHPSYEGDRAGITVMGESYAALSLLYEDGKLWLVHSICEDADTGAAETETARTELSAAKGDIFLRVEINNRSVCTFSYSTDGKRFRPVGDTFTARAGRWVGAKTGCFATALIQKNDGGTLDILEVQ